jgi:hypothetical protein
MKMIESVLLLLPALTSTHLCSGGGYGSGKIKK